MKAVSSAREMIPNTLCGSQKEAAKYVPDKMVVIKEPLNQKRTQATTRCSVKFYKAFRSHRSEAMLEPGAPFYLAINPD